MAKVKAKKATRVIHIYTPAEKREWAMMRAVDRCEESLARIFRGEVDPEVAMLLQSANQQEELEKLKARVLGTSTARPVRSRLGPHGSMAVNEMKKRQVDWIKESGRAMVEMLKMNSATPVVGVGRGMRLSQRKKNLVAK